MPIKKASIVLNTDDPEQKELYDFINFLPNGNKRNTSAFLRTLVDREYQKRGGSRRPSPSENSTVIKSEGGGIKFTLS